MLYYLNNQYDCRLNSVQTHYRAKALHTSSTTNRKRVYHDMKSLQSARTNFGHKKGVKIFTNIHAYITNVLA